MTKGGGRSGRTRDDGDGTGGQWSIVPVYDFSLRCRCRCCFRRHRKFRPRSLNRRCMRPRGLRLLRRLLGSSRRLFRLLRHGLVDATRIKTGGAAVRTILRQKPARPVIPHGDRKAGETKSSANKFRPRLKFLRFNLCSVITGFLETEETSEKLCRIKRD